MILSPFLDYATTFVFLGVGTLAWWLLAYLRSKKLNLPPGPIAFPIIGSAIQVALVDRKRPFVALQKLGKVYGNIISIQFATVRAVAVNGYAAIKEMETNPDFMDKLDDPIYLDKTLGLPYGILLSKGNYWLQTRRVSHRLLRDFGFEKNTTMETLVLEEIKEFAENWKSMICEGGGSAVVKIEQQFNAVFLNVIWSLLSGKRFRQNDPQLTKFIDVTNKVVENGHFVSGISGLFPALVKFAPRLTGFTELHAVNAALYKFYEDIVEEYMRDGAYKGQPPMSFIETFLQLIDENEPVKDPFDHIYTKENLIALLQDFVLAGNDTIGHSIQFLIRFVVQNPDVQRKLQEEVDRVTGRNRLICIDDKPELKYVKATLLENFRISNVVPTFPRKTNKLCRLGEYYIRKGTLMLPNYYSANMDESVWPNPEEFKPERFLSVSGEIINAEKIMSFGIGKRNCLGEQIAKTSMLLVLTFLIQTFSFDFNPATGMPDNSVNENHLRGTRPYDILIKLRE